MKGRLKKGCLGGVRPSHTTYSLSYRKNIRINVSYTFVYG